MINKKSQTELLFSILVISLVLTIVIVTWLIAHPTPNYKITIKECNNKTDINNVTYIPVMVDCNEYSGYTAEYLFYGSGEDVKLCYGQAGHGIEEDKCIQQNKTYCKFDYYPCIGYGINGDCHNSVILRKENYSHGGYRAVFGEKEVCESKEVDEIGLDKWERIKTKNCGEIECSDECVFKDDTKNTNPFRNPKTREECEIITQEFFSKNIIKKSEITKEWLNENCLCLEHNCLILNNPLVHWTSDQEAYYKIQQEKKCDRWCLKYKCNQYEVEVK